MHDRCYICVTCFDKWRECATIKQLQKCVRCQQALDENNIFQPTIIEAKRRAQICKYYDSLKRCPRCETLIEKNGGCDEMWCICGCIFEWHSLEQIGFDTHDNFGDVDD